MYFSYWELYLMEKPYPEEMIALFRSINGVKLMQDEMNHLKTDLRIIKAFPDVLVDHFVKINIRTIKERIIKTIEGYMSKILTAS